MPRKKSEEKSEKIEKKVKIKTTPEKEVEGKELEKVAEEESLKIEKKDSLERKNELEEKKKEVLQKAKKLKEKIDVTSSEDLKEEVKSEKKKDMLIPLDDYVKTGIYLGTRVVTPSMKQYVYRRRADGLAIFNTDLIDKKIKEGIEYLSKFDAKDIILVWKRQVGWRTALKFGELTGIRVFTKKYPAGILTNIKLKDFFENELSIIADSWLDKNALKDTLDVKKKVLMICGTNNFAQGADKIIIGNNKSGKSLGLIFYLLARGYCKAKEIKAEIPELDWWISEEDNFGED